MERLFAIETDRAALSWSAVRATRQPAAGAVGLLRLTGLRNGIRFGPGTFRAGVPPEVASNPALEAGPILLEETDYEVFCERARGPGSGRVSLHHDGLDLQATLREEDGGRIVHGLVNFGAHIGRSTFTLCVGGAPEVRFEVEVFPTKLGYVEDYRQILAEVQEIAAALGLAYLASTRREGAMVPPVRPTDLEWTLLLRILVDDLARALRHVAERPLRGLTRREAPLRAERVKRADAAIRAAVERERGRGPSVALPEGRAVRARVLAGRAEPTLDTPEHRWLAAQVAAIRRRLAAIRRAVAAGDAGARRRRTLDDLDSIEARLLALGRLEPLMAAAGEPPPGFASLRLLSAPGYREAYAACVTLGRGLHIGGPPLDLPVRSLAELYEVWCFLATVRVLAAIPGVSLDLRDVFRVRSEGLAVHLGRGRESAVRARGPGGCAVTVAFNPSIAHPLLLTPQRPDVLVTILDGAWPRLQLVIDAKYRLDDSPAYVTRYGAPGPPDDALNVLHRYRDAILESADPERPTRAVVQAVAVFPYRPPPDLDFTATKLFSSLEKLGIGAIPLLPGETRFLERWLSGALLGGGWARSATVPAYPTAARAGDWRRAATEAVLVGALRRQNPRQHLDWVCKQKRYYVPMTPEQRRQFVARWIAIYAPAGLRGGSAVTHVAEVTHIQVLGRDEIETPWPPARGRDETVLLYHLGEVKRLKTPIRNVDGRRVPPRMWSSRLALDRAEDLAHLWLETEPEWRLHERLRARGVAFHVIAGPARVEDPEDPRGRARFHGEGWTARYGGGGGFDVTVEGVRGTSKIAREEDVVEKVAAVVEPTRP